MKTTENTKLLKEWDFMPLDDIQRNVIKGLKKYLDGKGININIHDIDDTLGLAYTSSSAFAGLFACNGYKLAHNNEFTDFIGIVIDENLQSYLAFDNDKEETILIDFIQFAHNRIEIVAFQNNEQNKHSIKAVTDILNYLKQFDGKKILTNNGLSKKLDIPKHSIGVATKYGFLQFNVWIDASFNRIIRGKFKTCINGGGYPEDNFGISTYYCNYIESSFELGEIDDKGIFKIRNSKPIAGKIMTATEIKDKLLELKLLEAEKEGIESKIREIKYNLPEGIN